MSAASKILGLLMVILAMAVAGRKPGEVVAEIKAQAGDYWPHLEPLLTHELDRAADMLPDVAVHRAWFDALAAELTGTGKKKNGRATSGTAKAKPAAKAAASKAGSHSKRASRSKAHA